MLPFRRIRFVGAHVNDWSVEDTSAFLKMAMEPSGHVARAVASGNSGCLKSRMYSIANPINSANNTHAVEPSPIAHQNDLDIFQIFVFVSLVFSCFLPVHKSNRPNLVSVSTPDPSKTHNVFLEFCSSACVASASASAWFIAYAAHGVAFLKQNAALKRG
jgi:hypothetical protein